MIGKAMRKVITNMLFAILIAQFMMAGIVDFKSSEKDDLESISTQTSETSGRQAPHIPCAQFDGMGGPVWENDDPYSTLDIVEYPPGTGNYYILSEPNITAMNTTMSPVETNAADLWSGPCTCADIATGGVPTWDFNHSYYDPWQIVSWNSTYWIAQELGALMSEEPGNEGASGSPQDFWKPCSDRSPCSEFDGHGGPVWDSTASYAMNDTVEWPANSGQFWMSTTSGPTGEPASNGKWIGPCSCQDIWAASTSVVWDSNSTYDAGMMVEFPSGSGDIWMAIAPSTTMGVDPTYAWADGNEWELCSSDTDDGGPCAGLTVVGVWDSSINVTSGEIYEYPANSGMLYEVNPGGPFWSVNAPDIDLDVWSPIDCPCNETWAANGQPVWDSSIVNYAGNYVVEWPAGSGTLYISEGGGLTGAGEPGIDGHWMPCEEDSSDGGPCAGLTVVGVWDSSINVTSGEIYEYPANSGTLYQINPGSPFSSVSAPDIDLDVWSPIVCPCKETWDANGQPVWDSANSGYPGNYVVEWPAGSGTLYISEGGGLTSGAGEPGVDGHWAPCVEETPIADEEKISGIPSIGIFGTMAATSMGLFIANRRRQIT